MPAADTIIGADSVTVRVQHFSTLGLGSPPGKPKRVVLRAFVPRSALVRGTTSVMQIWATLGDDLGELRAVKEEAGRGLP